MTSDVAEQGPVMPPPACYASDNELDDDSSKDADELRELGPNAQFLLDMNASKKVLIGS